MDFNKLGGRKYTLAVAGILLGSAALFLSRMSGGEYVALVLGVLAAFGAANVAAKRNEAPVVEAPSVSPVTDYTSEIESLKAQNAQISEGVAGVQQLLTFIIQKTGLDK